MEIESIQPIHHSTVYIYVLLAFSNDIMLHICLEQYVCMYLHMYVKVRLVLPLDGIECTRTCELNDNLLRVRYTS